MSSFCDVAGHDALVDRGGGERGGGQRGGDADDEHREHRDDAEAVGRDERGEPAQLAPAAAGAAQAPARVLPQQPQALAPAGVVRDDRRAVVDGGPQWPCALTGPPPRARAACG